MQNDGINDTAGSLVKVDTSIGMEEVAAIKVAEVERACLIEQSVLRAELKDAETLVAKLNVDLIKAIPEDVRNEHGEIAEIDALLKKLFGKDAKICISHAGSGRATLGISCNTTIAFKGDKSKVIQKSAEAAQKDVVKAEDGLCEVKKKLGMLPHLERSAKAAVARARLNQSEAGKNLLAHMDEVTLPGLPAPKK